MDDRSDVTARYAQCTGVPSRSSAGDGIACRYGSGSIIRFAPLVAGRSMLRDHALLQVLREEGRSDGWVLDRDRFEFVTRWAVQPLDLLHHLRKLKPAVVHFSGHGTR